MIQCSNFNENICAYIDNELNIEERLSFEEHAQNCKNCKRELDEMTRIVHLCTSLPQQELPVNFKEELHEKLVAVAGAAVEPLGYSSPLEWEGQPEHGGQNGNKGRITPLRKTKGFLYMRTFAAVAAGMLVVVLAGVWFRFGWFSPAKTEDSANSTALAMQQPAGEMEKGAAADFAAAPEAAIAGESAGQARTFGAASVEPSASAEVDRSARVQNRDAAAAEMASGAETVNSKTSTILLTAVDPNQELEKVKLLIEQNSGEIIESPVPLMAASKSVAFAVETPEGQNTPVQDNMSQSGGEQKTSSANESVTNGTKPETAPSTGSVNAAAASGSGNMAATAGSNIGVKAKQLSFMIPDTQYDKFVAKLYIQLGAANVQPGALVTQDVTDVLSGSIAESEALDSQIQELQQKDSGKNAATIEELKASKEAIDKQIDDLRLRNDFVVVTVTINGK